MSETHDWCVATIEGISVPDVWTVMSLASISHLPDDVCNGRHISVVMLVYINADGK